MNEIEALDTLIGGYLNEDWPFDYGGPWAAVEAFVRHEPRYAPVVRADIDLVLAQSSSDRDLESRLAKFGLAYRPSVDGSIMYRDWLLAIADRVDDILRTSPAD